MKPSIVIIGAGSVEFTRELLGDILSFPELGGVPARTRRWWPPPIAGAPSTVPTMSST